MNGDTRELPQNRRVPLPFRWVVVPHWLNIILFGTYLWIPIDVLMENPRLFILGIIGAVVFGVLVVRPILEATSRGTDTDDSAAIRNAPIMGAALWTAWRHMRTYQLWQVTVLVVLDVLFFLSHFNIIPTF